MKKEQLKSGEIKLDDELDFSGSDFDFDMSDPTVDKKRTAASPVKDGAKEAARMHFSSDTNIRKYIGKALPKEYADLFDTYTTVRDEATGALDDVKKVTQKPINDFAKLINEKVADKHKRTKKALSWLIDKTDEYKAEKFDQRKADEDSINVAMGDLQNTLMQSFAEQAKMQEGQREEDNKRRDLELTTQAVNDARQLKLLSSIARSSDILAKTEQGFNIAEKKKSLELRYRMVFGIRDLVAGQKELTEVTRAYLKNIQHNTGLPDAQKLMLNERFHNTIKNKFVNGALGQFGPGGFLGGAVSNFRRRAGETAQDVADALSMAHSGVDMMTQDDLDLDDLTPEQKARKKRSKMATSLALDLAGPKVVGKASEALRNRMPGLEKRIQRGANQIGYGLQNADSIAKDFAYGGDASEKKTKQMMRSMVEMFLPSRDNDSRLRMASGDALFEPGANGSQATSRALVEVIPGLLARILQEQQIQRTGNTKQGLASFDYKTGTFRYASDMKNQIASSMSKNSTSDMVLDSLVGTLKQSGGELSKQDETQLKRFLMSSRMKGGAITPERLMDPTFYKSIKGEGAGDRISGAFRKHFESSDGKFRDSDENLKKRYQLISTINTAVSNASDPRAVIQQAVSEGHVELLREMGWIKEDGSINLERAYTYGIGEDDEGKDTSVWKPAQGKASRRRMRQTGGGFEVPPSPAAVFTPQPEPAKPAAAQESPNLSRSLLQALIEGQTKQSDWLEKIEHNTANITMMGSGEPGQEGQGSSGKGFFDRSIKDHARGLGSRINKARKGFMSWMKSSHPVVDKVKDTLASSWAFGARKFMDLKDGLPDLGDLYVYGSDKVRITKAMLESKTLVDAKGKVIASLKDLAESAGDIKDQAGNVILTEGEKLSSFIKANGITFTKVWYNRIKSAAKAAFGAGNALREKISGAARSVFGRTGKIAKAALSFANELIQPARDVYVMGEDRPRLLGYLFRQGVYFDKTSGNVVERAQDIHGEVVDESGQILLTLQDLKKGLVDVEGKPFKTLMQRGADQVRKNIANGKAALKKVLGLGKKAIGAVGSAFKTAKSVVGKFFNFGMSAFKGGSGGGEAQAASENPDLAPSLTVSILTQIRDILAERLPGGSGGGGQKAFSSFFSGGSVDPVGGTQEGKPPAEDLSPQTNTVSSKTGGLAGGLLGGLGSLAGKGLGLATRGVGKLGGLLKGRKGFLGKLGGFLSSSGSTDAAEPHTAAAAPAPTAQPSEARASGMQRLREKVAAARERARSAMTTKPTANDINGDGVRENSVIDKLRNKTNKNDASNARGGNREVQKLDTENAVDFVMGKLAAAKSLVGSIISGAADLFSLGGGKKAAGKVAGKVAGAFARGGMMRAAGSMALKGGLAAGKFLVGRAIPFIAMKAIPAVVGAIGTALSSPVIGGALAAAAVGGLAYWGYKKLYKNNNEVDVKDSASLKSVRMAEYGFSLDDTQQYGRMEQLEQLLEPAVVKTDKGVELAKDKIDASQLLTIFGISEEEPEKIKALLGWLENRFKPTFLKWQNIAFNLDKKLSKLEDQDKPIKLKILETVEMTNTGWDERASPFGMDADLTMGSKEIKALIAAAKKLLQVEAQRGKPSAKDLAEDVTKTGAKGAAATAVVNQGLSGNSSNGSDPNKGKALADKLGESPKDQALVNSAFKTGGLEALPGQRLDALSSIKLRAYGIAEPNMGSVQAINALEKAALPYLTVDKNGSSSANLDVEKLFDAAGRYFGVAKSNSSAYKGWIEWLTKRFMPVFSTYNANLQFHTGIKDLALAHRSLTAVQTAAIAHQLVAVPDIWVESLSGWPGKPGLADASSCDQFIQHLDEAAKKAAMQEVKAPKAPSPSEGSAKGYAQQRYDGMPTPDEAKSSNPYMQKALFKPAPPPDGEKEPQGSVGSSGSSTSSSGSGIGSIPLAAGELATGNAADQFIKLRKGAKLDGMNPEMLKLFRGMAEEYGTLTGKQIPVNSGARDFADQMALYKADPSKAAKPGGSLHEKGLAIDIDTPTANELERLGLMKKYGFTRPVGGETWHIEPAGIQTAIAQAKNDPNFATQAILKSPGVGGGGAGLTKTTFTFGKRSTEIAMASMKASGVDAKTDASGSGGSIQTAGLSSGQSGSAANIPVASSGSAGGSGGYAGSVQNVRDNQAPSSALREGTAGAGAYAAMPEAGDRGANMKLVAEAAKAVGVDPNVALTTVAMESSFKSNAAAGTSSAKGLNQFTSGTWSDMMKKHGKDLGIPPDASPNDPKANALLGAQFLKTNLKIAEKRGLPTDIVQAYLMHFLGAGGANTFNKLADSDIVAQAMPEAAAKNKPTFYDQSGKARTKAEMLAFITNKINKSAKDFGIDLGGSAPSASYSAAPQMASNASTSPASATSAAQVSPRSQSPSGSDYSQSYRPPRPVLGNEAVVRDTNSMPQSQSFDKLAQAIAQGQDVQVQQLTALNGILAAVKTMAEHLTNQQLSDSPSTQPPAVEMPPERPTPGSVVRQVAKPLVTA